MLRLRFLSALLLLTLAACATKTPADPDGATARDLGQSTAADLADAAAGPSDAQMNTAAARAAGLSSVGLSRAVASLFVLQGGTLDAGGTLADNVGYIADQIVQSLNDNVPASGTACANAPVVSGAKVTMNFGAGCQLVLGKLAGEVSVTLSKSGATWTASFQFTQFSFNGLALTGTLIATTSDGDAYTFNAALDLDTVHMTYLGTLSEDRTGIGVVFVGGGTWTQSGVSVNYVTTDLHHGWGACYPDGGTATLTPSGSAASATVTFLGTTPGDGKVQVSLAGRTGLFSLPAYGTCPATRTVR